MYVRCTPSTPGETFRRSFNRTLNSTRLRPDGCKNRGRVPSRRKRIPCRPPPKGKGNWVTELALDDPVFYGCPGPLACAFQVTRIKVECCRDERFVKARRVNAKNFLAELNRRNVYKVAIAYGVVAWLLMQIASQIFPFFEIPNWAVRLVVLLLIIGL